MQASHEDSLTEHVPIRRVHDRRPLAAACPAAHRAWPRCASVHRWILPRQPGGL